ncbi:MAG TPA: hypothetical protein VMU39_00185 [Solirubrobacteraceae bacterium]|nr:hypothetical protein [Solirubrobacteraceae bacterium]
MTILHALKLRGADVQYVLCDGLYTDCDQFWAAVSPRPPHACTICQAQVTKLVADMGMDFQWLGRYLMPEEPRKARRWEQSLATDELLTATFGDWRVADWVCSSLQSHFRASELVISDAAVEQGVRSYLFSGLTACFALDRLLAETAPDVMLLFNGRQSSTRVALELARARDIRVVVHERGPRAETLLLVENASCQSLEPIRRYWREWGDVPLTPDELEAAAGIMTAREHGRDTGWLPYTGALQPSNELMARLSLSADRPVWVLFTSSDDEAAGNEEFSSPFGSQREWIKRTIEHARRNSQIDLVIRVHPNTGSRRSNGANQTQLAQMRSLVPTLPPNVRMIDAEDETSAYSLMDLCSVGLVWMSTVGLELACKGKNVVIAAGNYAAGTSFVHTVEDADGYEEILESLLAVPPGTVSAEVRRSALRLTYGMFFRLRVHFPLVRMPDPQNGELAYTSLDELLPGRDDGVDRCARVILDGERVCPPPTAADRARTTEAEDAFLAGFGERRVTVLAFADELIADPPLLEAWAATFEGHDRVTLLIHTSPDETPRLVQAVTRAGLDRADGPDLIAGEIDAAAMASVSAVFSRMERNGSLVAARRYEPGSLRELAEWI